MNKKTLTPIILAGIFFLMLGLSFAAVPLYDLFCRVTGFGGTTQNAENKEIPKIIINQDYKIKEVFKKASDSNVKIIKSFKTLKNLRFVELPKLGLDELTKIIKKIKKSSGCILMIDYGYLKSNNQSTLQSVMGHKKNNLLNNLGKADITSHVNFPLLKEFFKKKKLKIKNIISQKEFLENMGILKRAEIISNKMKFSEQSNLYLRLKRLLNPRLMGNLFKVILAHKTNFNNFAGFK